MAWLLIGLILLIPLSVWMARSKANTGQKMRLITFLGVGGGIGIGLLTALLVGAFVTPDKTLVETRTLVPFYNWANPLESGTLVRHSYKNKTFYYYRWRDENGSVHEAYAWDESSYVNVEHNTWPRVDEVKIYREITSAWYFTSSAKYYKFTISYKPLKE